MYVYTYIQGRELMLWGAGGEDAASSGGDVTVVRGLRWRSLGTHAPNMGSEMSNSELSYAIAAALEEEGEGEEAGAEEAGGGVTRVVELRQEVLEELEIEQLPADCYIKVLSEYSS
jgi:hypothetical protein